MKKLLPLLLLLAGACQRATPPTATACIDPAKIQKDAMCTMQYDPVCGCDGQTYANACMATNAGVTSFVPGPCATTPTTPTPR